MARRKSFEEFFIKSGTMYIGDSIPTPKYRRPIPPPPPTPKKRLWEIPDMDYESPIEIYLSQMQGRLEEEVYNAVQSYGIRVDKDELIKAIKYDRHQYVKGFKDGIRKFAEMLKTIEGLEENELFHNVVDGIAEELEGGHIEY
jgi:hypothetical protein